MDAVDARDSIVRSETDRDREFVTRGPGDSAQPGLGWQEAVGIVTVSRFGAVAQLAERFHGMEEVRGSIPLSSTPHEHPDRPWLR